MHISFKKEESIESTSAIQQITLLTKQFNTMIETNAQALLEIKALEDNEAIETMRTIVFTHLEDVDPVAMVSSMLELKPDEYNDYLDLQAAKFNLDLTKEIVVKHKDRYQDSLQEFLDESKLTSNLGNYTLQMDSLEYQVNNASNSEVQLSHQNSMHPEVVLHSTGLKQKVADDVVGLEDFAQDVEPLYFKFDKQTIENDLSNDFIEHMNDDYVPDHHVPCIENLEMFLSGGS